MLVVKICTTLQFSRKKVVLLSCLFPSAFKISFAMLVCVVTLLSMLASLPGYRYRVLSGL